MKNKLKLTFSFLVMAAMLCACGSDADNTTNTVKEEAAVKTAEVKSSNFDFLKTGSFYTIPEENFKNVEGYSNSVIDAMGTSDLDVSVTGSTFRYVITDTNEIEYAEYNKTSNRHIILDNDKYTVYIYANSLDGNDENMSDVFVINKSIDTDKPSMMVKEFCNSAFTGEYILKGDILWIKFVDTELKALLDSNDLFGECSRSPYLGETWNFIDLSGKQGALSIGNAILSENKEYYLIRDIGGLEIGKTDTLYHTLFRSEGKTENPVLIITNSGEAILKEYGNYRVYTINDNNSYKYENSEDFLYVSDNAFYTLSNYGIMKYTNTGSNIVLKFVDFGPNTEVHSCIIKNGDYPQVKLKSGNKEEIITLTDY